MGESRKQREKRRARESVAMRNNSESAKLEEWRSAEPRLPFMTTFVSIADIAAVPAESMVAQALATVPVERTLDWIAHLLRSLFHTGSARQDQISLVREWFGHDTAEALALARAVLFEGRTLFSPAVLKLMATLALVYGSDSQAGDHENQADVQEYLTRTLPTVMLTIAYYYGDSTRGPGGPSEGSSLAETASSDGVIQLELELAANSLATHIPQPQSMFHRSQRRWIEIPESDPEPEAVDLGQQYYAATGARLDDLRTVGLALHSRAISREGAPRVNDDYLLKLGIGPERLAAVLDVISMPLNELRQKVKEQPPMNLYDTPLLNMSPIIRLLDGQLLVLGPHLLSDRAFGWLPKWDLQEGRLSAADAARAVQYLEHVTEVYARESLAAAAAAPVTEGVVYGETEIQQAWGTQGTKNADAVLVWPGQAVVVEISSRAPMLDTRRAHSGPESGLARDLALGIVEKAHQLDATVTAMRADPAALTGNSTPPTRFHPVLVTTEGFPVMAPVIARIHKMLADEGLLTGTDVAPLVVVDVEALEAAETVGEKDGGPTLAELLAAHEQSELAAHSFKNWLVTTYSGPSVPRRIRTTWSRVADPVLSALTEA